MMTLTGHFPMFQKKSLIRHSWPKFWMANTISTMQITRAAMSLTTVFSGIGSLTATGGILFTP